MSRLFPLRSIVSNFFNLLNALSGIDLNALFFRKRATSLGSLLIAETGMTSNVQLLRSSSKVEALIPLKAFSLIAFIGLLLNCNVKDELKVLIFF